MTAARRFSSRAVLLGIPVLAWAAADPAPAPGEADPRRAPAPSRSEARSSARGISSESHNILAEMWQRRILPTDAAQWSPEDMALLRRLQNAEAAGAFSALKARFGSLKGMAALHRPVGSAETRLRLTKEGYERYLRLRTQQALEYFEGKGVDAKWGFQLKDLQGRALFDSGGLLSEAGEELYNRVLANREARWQAPSGEIFGNRPPKP